MATTKTTRTRKTRRPAGRVGQVTRKPRTTKATGTTTRRKTKTVPSSLQKRIEEKAYELYTRRGGVHGNDLLDWRLAQDLVELESKAALSKKLGTSKIKTKKMQEEVERRAYELYEYRGGNHGSDLFDWSLAEEITKLRNKIR